MKLSASQLSAYERMSSRRISYQPGYIFVLVAGKIALKMKCLHQANVLAKSLISIMIRFIICYQLGLSVSLLSKKFMIVSIFSANAQWNCASFLK